MLCKERQIKRPLKFVKKKMPCLASLSDIHERFDGVVPRFLLGCDSQFTSYSLKKCALVHKLTGSWL